MNNIEHKHRFSQSNPAQTCPYAAWHIVQSLHKGYEVRCWEPRCCFEGNGNWSYKHGLCITRLHDYIPEEREVYRGHLRMPKDSTPEQHIRTRRNFLQSLSRWKARKGYRLELHAVIDITDSHNAHWDTIAFSDAPKKPLRAAVATAWARAGGLRESLVPLDPSELAATAKYTAKDTTDPSKARKHLPASQAEMGLNLHWSTSGFWIKSKDTLWEEWKQEWFGSESGCRPILDRDFRLKQISKLKTLTSDWEAYLKAFEWYSPERNTESSGSLAELLN